MLTNEDLEKIGQLFDRKLDQRFADLEKKTESRFVQFEKKIEGRLTQFEERINKNIQFIIGIEIAKQTKSINKRLRAFDIRFDLIDQKLASFEDRLTQLEFYTTCI